MPAAGVLAPLLLASQFLLAQSVHTPAVETTMTAAYRAPADPSAAIGYSPIPEGKRRPASATPGEPLAPIATLIEKVRAHQHRVEELRSKYYCTEIDDVDDVDKLDGVSRHAVEEYELSWPGGVPVRHLLLRNGRPLTARERYRQDRELDHLVMERRQELEQIDARDKSITIDELLRTSLFTGQRRTTYKGRPTIAVSIVGNPEFMPHTHAEVISHLIYGTIWIDDKNLQVARIDALLDSEFLEAAVGISLPIGREFKISLEQEPVNDELWLPASAEFILPGMVDRIAGVRRHVKQNFRDYQPFATTRRKPSENPTPKTIKDLKRAY
jgi:hypothetical protein